MEENELNDHSGVGSSSVQVVDSSTPENMLIAEGVGDIGHLHDEQVERSCTEPDQTDHPAYHEICVSNEDNCVQSSVMDSVSQSVRSLSDSSENSVCESTNINENYTLQTNHNQIVCTTTGMVESSHQSDVLLVDDINEDDECQSSQSIDETEISMAIPSSSDSLNYPSTSGINSSGSRQDAVSESFENITRSEAEELNADNSEPNISEVNNCEAMEFSVVSDSGNLISVSQADSSSSYSLVVTSNSADLQDVYPTSSDVYMVHISSNSDIVEENSEETEVSSQETDYISQGTALHSFSDEVCVSSSGTRSVTDIQVVSSQSGESDSMNEIENSGVQNEMVSFSEECSTKQTGCAVSSVSNSDINEIVEISINDQIDESISYDVTTHNNVSTLNSPEHNQDEACVSSGIINDQGESSYFSDDSNRNNSGDKMIINSTVIESSDGVIFVAIDNSEDSDKESANNFEEHAERMLEHDNTAAIDSSSLHSNLAQISQSALEENSVTTESLKEAHINSSTWDEVAEECTEKTNAVVEESNFLSSPQCDHQNSPSTTSAVEDEISSQTDQNKDEMDNTSETVYTEQNVIEQITSNSNETVSVEQCNNNDVTTTPMEVYEESLPQEEVTEHPYALHLQQSEDGEHVTYIVQDEETGTQTSYQIVSNQHFSDIHNCESELLRPVQHQLLDSSVQDDENNMQRYILQTNLEGEEVLLQLPNMVRVEEGSNSQLITLEGDGKQTIEIIGSDLGKSSSEGTVHILSDISNIEGAITSLASDNKTQARILTLNKLRTDDERQTAAVLTETLPRRALHLTENQSISESILNSTAFSSKNLNIHEIENAVDNATASAVVTAQVSASTDLLRANMLPQQVDLPTITTTVANVTPSSPAPIPSSIVSSQEQEKKLDHYTVARQLQGTPKVIYEGVPLELLHPQSDDNNDKEIDEEHSIPQVIYKTQDSTEIGKIIYSQDSEQLKMQVIQTEQSFLHSDHNNLQMIEQMQSEEHLEQPVYNSVQEGDITTYHEFIPASTAIQFVDARLQESGEGEMILGDATAIMQVEQGEEVQVLRSRTYDSSDGTIIQQEYPNGTVLDTGHVVQSQTSLGNNAETDYNNEIEMALTNGELVHSENRNVNVELESSTPQVIDVSGTGSSVISPDNMQALIQILQALPLNTRGQTLQIVLQGNGNNATPTTSEVQLEEMYQVSEMGAQTPKEQVVHVLQVMPNGSPPTKMMSDMAVQVTPEDTSNMISSRLSSSVNNFKTSLNNLQNSFSSKRGGSISNRARSIKRSFHPPLTPTALSDAEDTGFDTKSGVSYYAVIDYLSEQEQEGYSSSQELNQTDIPSAGFMEDHLELQNSADGNTNRSLLESTLDASTIVSPYRRKGRYKVLAVCHPGASIDLLTAPNQALVTLAEKTYEQAILEGKNLAEQTFDDSDPINRPPRYTRGLRPIPRRLSHKCGYCEYESRDKILVVQHCQMEHPEEPIKTLLFMPKCNKRQCPYCKQEFNYAEFFHHMRYMHNEVHPFKCFYCDFQGRDRNQVKHHIRKKHGKPTRIINLMRESREEAQIGKLRIMTMSEGEESVYEYITDEDDDHWDDTCERRGLACPECKKPFKTLKYLKTHIKMHRPHRFQCGYCDYIATLEHQILKHSIRKHGSVEPKVISKELEPEKNPLISRNIDDVVRKVFSLSMRQPKDPDVTKWARKWACPHCDYTCQFGASFRRHIRMHANLLPFKCNYCSFKGREKYYVRRHIARMHRGLPEIVVDNTAENRAGDTSSDGDFQEKGLRRRRRRRVKDIIKVVVPLDELPVPNDVQLVVKKGEQHNSSFPLKDHANMESPQNGQLSNSEFSPPKSKYDRNPRTYELENIEYPQKTKYQISPKTPECTSERVSDYCKARVGDYIICNVCNQKIHARVFYKHVRKHFRVMPFKCGYCDYTSVERVKIYVHTSFKHPNLPFKIEKNYISAQNSGDSINTSENNENPPKTVVKFSCPLCQEQVNGDEPTLREHLYNHYDYYPFKCSICETQFLSKEKVISHGLSEHDKDIIASPTGEPPPEGLEETISQFMKDIDNAKARQMIDFSDVPIKRKRGRPPKVDKNSPQFQCPICERLMNYHSLTIRRHFYSHFDYKPFKCGYCMFQGTSDNDVKQHCVTHGNVPFKIEMTNDPIPPKLKLMLEKFVDEGRSSQKPRLTVSVQHSPESMHLLTEEGKRWKYFLTQGICPWCEANIGNFRPTAYRHLKAHFECQPYKCGLCSVRASERQEIKQHFEINHYGEPVSIMGPTIETAEIETGLKNYFRLKQKKNIPKPTLGSIIKELGIGDETDHNDEVTIPAEGGDSLNKSITDLHESSHSGGIIKTYSKHLFRRRKSRQKVYHSDSEILHVNDIDATLITRSSKSEPESDGSDTETRESITFSRSGDPEHEDIDIPTDVIADVHYILKLSCLPHEVPLFKRKTDWNRCTQCKRKFRKFTALKHHIATEHAVEAVAYHCCYCEYFSFEKAMVRTHIIASHPRKRMLIKEKVHSKKRGPYKRKRELHDDIDVNAKKPRLSEMKKTDNESEETVAKIAQFLIESAPRKKRGRPRKNPLPNVHPIENSSIGENKEQYNETQMVVINITDSNLNANGSLGENVIEIKQCQADDSGRMEITETDLSKNPLQFSHLVPDNQYTVQITQNAKDIPKEIFTNSEMSLVNLVDENKGGTQINLNDIKDSEVLVVEQDIENLEECDENLPKILHILHLRPSK